MTTAEFSNQFDVLYNNIMSNQAPGLDEYEKSVFLTKAQDEIILAYFNPKGNKFLEGFDDSAKRLIDFSNIIVTTVCTLVSDTASYRTSNNSKFFKVPSDILLYVNEKTTVYRNNSFIDLITIPLSYLEYNRLLSKPFKRPLKNLAWRIIANKGTYTYTDYYNISVKLAEISEGNRAGIYTSLITYGYSTRLIGQGTYYVMAGDQYLLPTGERTTISPSSQEGLLLVYVYMNSTEKATVDPYVNILVSSGEAIVEVIPGGLDTIHSYKVRYVLRPTPIILLALNNEGVTINTYVGADANGNPVTSNATLGLDCKLDPILHEEILQRAVELAKAAYLGEVGTIATIGLTSSTNVGIIPSSKG